MDDGTDERKRNGAVLSRSALAKEHLRLLKGARNAERTQQRIRDSGHHRAKLEQTEDLA
jgi:hypothetical protein